MKYSPYHDRPCPKCGARAGDPCASGNAIYVDGWVHKARQVGGLRLVHPSAKVAPTSKFRLVHCPCCRAKPGEPCHRPGAALRTHHTARIGRYRAALARVVPADPANMAGRPRVVAADRVYRWTGTGWEDLGPPAYDDDLLPRVTVLYFARRHTC